MDLRTAINNEGWAGHPDDCCASSCITHVIGRIKKKRKKRRRSLKIGRSPLNGRGLEELEAGCKRDYSEQIRRENVAKLDRDVKMPFFFFFCMWVYVHEQKPV